MRDADDDDLDVRPATPRHIDGDAEELSSPGGRRPPAWLIAVGIGVLGGAVIAVAVARNVGGRRAAPSSAPTPAGSSVPSPGPRGAPSSTLAAAPAGRSPLPLGRLGPATDLALAKDGTLFVIARNGLMRTGSVRWAVTRAVPRYGTSLLAVDSSARLVWAVGGSNEIYAYDVDSLRRVGHAHLRVLPFAPVSAVAALDGRLYLATASGVYAVESPRSAPRRVPGFRGGVLAISADPRRHRLLGVSVDHSILEIHADRVRAVPQSSPDVLPDTVLVTDEGIWAVGFGAPGGSRVAGVDPRALRVRPVGRGDSEAAQGAQGAAGSHVFWVRDAYQDTVLCHDAGDGTGAVVYRGLPETGTSHTLKIVSRPGMAYAITAGNAVRLETTPGCPG